MEDCGPRLGCRHGLPNSLGVALVDDEHTVGDGNLDQLGVQLAAIPLQVLQLLVVVPRLIVINMISVAAPSCRFSPSSSADGACRFEGRMFAEPITMPCLNPRPRPAEPRQRRW